MISPATLSLWLCPPPPPSNEHKWRHRRISLTIQAFKSGRRGEDDCHSTLKALNSKGRIVPRKSLGQHYMLNSRINEQLSSIAGVVEGDVVLEIGPRTGSQTNVLINAGATVIAVGKDPHTALIVKERFGCSDQLADLADIIPKESLIWNFELLKSASSYVTSRLHAVKYLPEGRITCYRARMKQKDCGLHLKTVVRYFKESGHTLLFNDRASC